MMTIFTPIAVSPGTLPGGTKNIAYPTGTTLSATGGTAPYTFAVTAGTLPPGLNLAANGALTGTPTATGTFTFTVTATDAHGFTATQPYTISVSATPLRSIAVTPANGTVKVGQVQQYVATGTYQDNSTQDITSAVSWTSDAAAIIRVDSGGTGTAQSPGTAHITATQGGISGAATITVSAPTPIGIAPAPQPASRPADTTNQPSAPPAPSGTGRGGTTGGTAPAPAPPGR
jgi:hypothetical protein